MTLRKSPSMNYERLQSFKANADLSTVNYVFVTISNDGGEAGVGLAAADGPVDGVLINNGKEDETVEVLTEFGARVILRMADDTATAIPPGTKLACAGNGRAKIIAAGAQATPYHAVTVGENIPAQTGDDQDGLLVEAFFYPNTTAA